MRVILRELVFVNAAFSAAVESVAQGVVSVPELLLLLVSGARTLGKTKPTLPHLFFYATEF